MKKLISLVLVTAIVLTLCPYLFSQITVSAKEEVGERINISTVSDLKKLSGKLNAHAVLQKDIEISASTWTPIGSIEQPFTGIFDGNGHTIIYDIDVRSFGDTGVVAGLFGCVSGSIKRLTVEGKLSVKAASANVGSIVGCLVNGGTVFNCYSNVAIDVESAQASSVGGIVGTVLKSSASTEYDAEVVRCESFGVINASVGTQNVSDGSALSRGTSGAIGGIVGFVADTASVR